MRDALAVKIPVGLVKVVVVLVLAGWALWLYQLWQPARQVELHTLNFLQRASARDWPAVLNMMSDDYRDTWGHDRTRSIDEARKVLSHFFALQIVPLGPVRLGGEGGERSATVEIGVFGSGTGVAHAVMDAVREAEGPFLFRWRKNGTWPWQWALVEAGQEVLQGVPRADVEHRGARL